MSGRDPALTSAYYPPRAAWRSRVARATQPRATTVASLMRRLHGLRTFGREVVCLLVPGVSFCLAGWPRLGLCILAGWVAALALYAVGVGLPTANWAFMLLITAHAASVAQHFQPWLVQQRLRTRMATGTLLFLAVSLLVYAPARHWFERHVATPLPVGTSTLLVNPRVHPASIQRGDWLAYRIEGSYAHGVQVRRGYGFGPVLAMPGDRVAFGERTFRVNGKVGLRLTHMPSTGEPGGVSRTLACLAGSGCQRARRRRGRGSPGRAGRRLA